MLPTRLLVAAGAAGPVLFWLLVTIAGLASPGYDPLEASISSLVNQPAGALLTLAFLGGVGLGTAWAVGAGRSIGSSSRDRAIVRVLFLAHVGVSLAFAAFPTDPDGGPRTVIGALHLATFMAYALLIPATLLLVSRVFGRDRRWRRFAGPTMAIGLAMVVATLLVPLTIRGPLSPWLGLLERVYVAIPMAWQFVTALSALKTTSRAVPTAP
jgi:hypothetical membrane protein